MEKLACLGVAVVVFIVFIVVGGSAAFGVYNNGLGDNSNSQTKTVSNPANKAEWEAIFKNAESVIKVPWEVLAAIMWQESGLGHNFGSCSYFPAAPADGHVLVNDDGLRDQEDKTAFEEIVSKLNYPKNKEVSCNPKGSNGGAMGYMQVMPREWRGASKKILNANLVTEYPDPWNGQDAIYIGGVILKGKIDLWVEDTFPETAESIKSAAGRYYGDTSASYKEKVYAKYLEIKELGRLP